MSEPIEQLKQELLDKMNEIEKECGGLSNIGLTSEYWDYLRQYRSLEAQLNARRNYAGTNQTT